MGNTKYDDRYYLQYLILLVDLDFVQLQRVQAVNAWRTV